ncbi:hypothetical protein GUJ93_ZPchr0006g43721 [Zizania palustris]|uniref:Uncharacterized protein n=1 Tax=Zizania palustris TaxID=103762 RepID=A0A8J5T319_ZIZPA|nr:hypothetical protein GUJ93_ZPchr0006g43721 [Zizania palustris]
MAKPSPAALHTPRLRSSRTFVGSSSAPKLPLPRDVKAVAKCLDYDDNFAFPDSPDVLGAPDDDLAPLLELPDPGDSSSSTLISANPDDAVTASADSALAEVVAPADSTEEPLPEQINLVLAELHGARDLSPRSKRLLAALAEVAAAELSSTATALRLRRAAFWGKVRVGVLAATVAVVAAVDIALAVVLMARRGNDHYHVLPPT